MDIEGGTGTILSFSSKGRRELPDARVLIDGQVKRLSKDGSFVNISTRRCRAPPCTSTPSTSRRGMLEKLSPTLLAGVPAIVKPDSPTAYLTEAAFKIMIEADVLPAGCNPANRGQHGATFCFEIISPGQDVVGFTGSASHRLETPSRTQQSVRDSGPQFFVADGAPASTPRLLGA